MRKPQPGDFVYQLSSLVLAFVLGSLPGKIADGRGHPQADAIRVAGWLGLLTMGLLWPFALIWAYTTAISKEETAELRASIDRLGERVAAVEHKGAAGPKEERTDS